MPDPIRKRSGKLRPALASCGYYGQRADRIGFGSYTPDPTYRIRFISVLPQESMDHIAQNRPGLVRVWPNTSGQETSRCAGIIVPGFWKDATSPLPVSHLLTPFRSSTDVPDNIVQSRQPGSVLVLADSIGFWPNGIRSGRKPMCKNHPARFWPMLPSRSGPDANRTRHVCWDQYCSGLVVSTFLKRSKTDVSIAVSELRY